MAISALLFLSVILSLTAWSFEQSRSSSGGATVAEANLGTDRLLETGATSLARKPIASQAAIKVISYNIRWRSGDDLDKIINLLRNDPEIGNATLLGLQEVDRAKKRSSNTNTVKRLAHALNLHYAWAAPPPPSADDEEETGVAILSAYPLTEVTRIVLPHLGPNRRRRVALGATVEIGGLKIRFYSVHSETRIATKKKLEQMDAVIQDLGRHPKQMPAIVVGDFNTWETNADRKTIKLFTSAGFQTPFSGQTTFSRRILFVPFELRLDWIWLRGLTALTYGVDRKVDISDHWPLWANLKPSQNSGRQ